MSLFYNYYQVTRSNLWIGRDDPWFHNIRPIHYEPHRTRVHYHQPFIGLKLDCSQDCEEGLPLYYHNQRPAVYEDEIYAFVCLSPLKGCLPKSRVVFQERLKRGDYLPRLASFEVVPGFCLHGL